MSAVGLAACTDESPVPDPFQTETAGANSGMESEVLAERVAAGELPPLEERLPRNPMVVEPWDEVGVHGGTLNRATTSGNNAVHVSFASSALLEWNREGNAGIPSLAESFEATEDNSRFTFVIREGLRWSDGEPYTIEDLKFCVDGISRNKTLAATPPRWMQNADGSEATFEFPDDLTMVVQFNSPFALFEKYMCHPSMPRLILRPKHYLEQFHPDYNPDAGQLAKDAGYDTWDQYMYDRMEPWTNPDLPVMGPYVVTTPIGAGGSAVMERNPYFWKVDTAGNQLPYIDTIQVQKLGQETLDLRAANGDLQFQGYEIGYNSVGFLIENAEANKYEVERWAAPSGLLSFYLNLSHKDEKVREIFHEKDFRVALSIAIDRDDLNTTLLGGVGDVRHPMPSERSDYYVEGTGQEHLDFDAERANELLDGLSLPLGSDGIRTRPDGTKLSFVVISRPNPSGVSIPDTIARVKQYWAAVGIEIVHSEMDPSLYGATYTGNDYDIDITWLTTPDDWDMEPVWFVPTSSGSHMAPAYGLWASSGGAEGIEPPEEFKQLLTYWDDLRQAPTDEARIEAGRNVIKQYDENFYVIGTVAPPFQPVVVGNQVRNVRDDNPPLSYFHLREGFTKPEQLFFAG